MPLHAGSGARVKAWAEKLEECTRLRKGYQQQQAVGLMSLEELGEMLKELEETASWQRRS
jgi:hypothetical protein